MDELKASETKTYKVKCTIALTLEVYTFWKSNFPHHGELAASVEFLMVEVLKNPEALSKLKGIIRPASMLEKIEKLKELEQTN